MRSNTVGALTGLARLTQAKVVAIIFFALSVPAASGQEGVPVTLDAIQKAWQARQDRVRTARFTWKEQRTWPKGSISSAYGPVAIKKMPEIKGKIMPSADTTVDFSYTLALDVNKVRFEYEGKEWANDIQDFRVVKYLSVFDGKTAKDVYPGGVGHANWPVGFIRKSAIYNDAGLASLRPLLLVCRPFVPALLPCDIRAMTLQSQQSEIDGHSCVRLTQQLSKHSSVHFWVEPSRGFVCLRRLIIEDGHPLEQMDFHYRPDSSIGWITTGWKIVDQSLPVGGLSCSINATLISAEFNIGVEQNSFDLEFPLGARVEDERTMENYIVRHDGTKRAVLPEDIGATYDQMLNSAPGEALQPQSRRYKPHWLLAISVITGLLTLAVFLWRRLPFSKSHSEGIK